MKHRKQVGVFGTKQKKQKIEVPYPHNPVMAGALAGFIVYAATNPKIVAHFEKISKIKFPFVTGQKAERLIDTMLKSACTVDSDFPDGVTPEQRDEILFRWTQFLIKHYWGDANAENS